MHRGDILHFTTQRQLYRGTPMLIGQCGLQGYSTRQTRDFLDIKTMLTHHVGHTRQVACRDLPSQQGNDMA